MKSKLSKSMLRGRGRGRFSQKNNRRRGHYVETLEPRNLLATIGTNFTAGSGPGFIPPDTMGAVGPTAIVELINGRYAVYDKTGAVQTASSLDQFWTSAGVTPANFSFDPRILYDDASEHWFAVAVDDARAPNSFLVAVSDSSDPLDGWTGFKVDSDSNDSHWADFPMLGMNHDVITISANMFDLADSSANASFLVLPKSDLLATPPTVANATLIEDVTLTGFSSQPIVDLDDGSLPLNILSSFNKPAGMLKASSVDGTPTAPTINAVGGMITVTPRFAPPDIDQPGLRTDVDAGDNRFSGNVVQQHIVGRPNPSIWGVQGVEIDGRAAIEWYEIDALTYNVLQSGTIADSSLAFNYPSIAVNDFGDVAIGFSGGDPSTFISTYVATGQTNSGVTTFDPVLQTHAGVAEYENLDGIGRNRWGDYSATVIDPTDQQTMWTFQEFVSGVDQWSIRVTEIVFSPPSEIQGLVWQDDNANGQRETGERGLGNWTVYLDLNNSGVLDPNEPSAVTDIAGLYTLETGVGRGNYTVAQITPPLWEPTVPASGRQVIAISQRGETIENVNFGNRTVSGSVSGIKWNDIDGDGIHDPQEPGLGGVYIYADLNNDGRIALGEPAAITATNGSYRIDGVRAGEIPIREVQNSGWSNTYPPLGYHLVDVLPAANVASVDFGNTASVDWGDAPSPYPTLATAGGASHGVLPGFLLGALIDGEANGIPSSAATGDDTHNLADEDGVIIPGPMFAGGLSSVDVVVMTSGLTRGYLQAWVDFNADGDWYDAGEQIATNLRLGEGTHTVSFVVPAGATVGRSFARFRYALERDLGPTGPASAGEVEDHAVLILKDEPVANSDHFAVDQNSTDNSLDVLDNDYPSSTGTLRITSVTQPAHGEVTIASGGQSLLFTPDFGQFSPPEETFSYTINDGTGKTDTATVNVFVRPQLTAALAVDDTFRVAPGSGVNALHVLANDLPGVLGTMQLFSIDAPSFGTATINNNGTADPLDDYIAYTPNGAFVSMDQFEYTISDANGTSSATVTVLAQPAPADLSTAFSLALENLAGDPIDAINVNEQFVLVVSTQDLRTGIPVVDSGIFAAYMDLLYDRFKVVPVLDAGNDLGFAITFSASYPNGISGDAYTPGILNEVGAFQPFGATGLGTGEVEMCRVVFTATAAGVADFTANPADESPDHDTLHSGPPAVVDPADINYGLTSLTIIDPTAFSRGSVAEGEATDVNADGYVSPIDALLVITHLNSRAAARSSGTITANPRLDVNRDSVVSPIDVLLVIKRLNAGPTRGEGEGESGVLASVASPLVAPSGLAVSQPSLVLSTATPAPTSVTGSAAAVLAFSTAPIDPPKQIGEATPYSVASIDPDKVLSQSWESLLDTLAEDILET